MFFFNLTLFPLMHSIAVMIGSEADELERALCRQCASYSEGIISKPFSISLNSDPNSILKALCKSWKITNNCIGNLPKTTPTIFLLLIFTFTFFEQMPPKHIFFKNDPNTHLYFWFPVCPLMIFDGIARTKVYVRIRPK